MVFHTQSGAMRQCVKTCNPGYYHTTNKLCLTDCTGSFFRERQRTIGANGTDQGTSNYYVCTPNKCASDQFFRLESTGADNICMNTCESVGANTYSLEARLVVTNSGQDMKRCIQSCEVDEVFVPEHDFNLSATYTPSDFTIMKCMTSCPTSANSVSSSLIPKFVITNDHITDVQPANRSTTSAFYNVIRSYCTPACVNAGSSFSTITHKDSALVCSTQCPPDVANIPSTFKNAGMSVLYYYDTTHALSDASHKVCMGSCNYYQMISSQMNCVNRCSGSNKFRNEIPHNTFNNLEASTAQIKTCITDCPAGKWYFYQSTSTFDSQNEFECKANCD
jgi:hypothetical protein